MTVSSTNNQNRYEGNGVTDTFAFTGRVFTTADLTVQIITRATDAVVETLTLTTDYSVTIDADGEGANITTVSGKIPSGTQDILIFRDIPLTQTVDLPTGTRFPAESVEDALDKVTAAVQDQAEKFDRAVLKPINDSGAIVTIAGDLTADTLLQVNSGGTQIESSSVTASDVGTIAGISSDITTVAGISSDVTAVAADATDIGTVAGSIANVNIVAADIADINTVAADAADIVTVAADISNVNTVATNITGVNSFAERYRVASSDPATSLDEGDLVYNTTANALKYYDGSSWVSVAAPDVSAAGNNTWTGANIFQGVVDVTNVNAETSSGGNLRTNGGANCLSWGGGGGANSTLGGNMSGAGTHKLVNMADPTAAQDYATKAYVDTNTPSSGLVLLGSYTASNVTSVDIGSGLDLDAAIDGTYDVYEIHCVNIDPNATSTLNIRTSSDGGSTFDSASSDYRYISQFADGSSTNTIAYTSTTATSIRVCTGGTQDNTTGTAINSIIRVIAPATSNRHTVFMHETTYVNAALYFYDKGIGARYQAAAVDALRLYMSSGNITSGTFYLYGIKKS